MPRNNATARAEPRTEGNRPVNLVSELDPRNECIFAQFENQTRTEPSIETILKTLLAKLSGAVALLVICFTMGTTSARANHCDSVVVTIMPPLTTFNGSCEVEQLSATQCFNHCQTCRVVKITNNSSCPIVQFDFSTESDDECYAICANLNNESGWDWKRSRSKCSHKAMYVTGVDPLPTPPLNIPLTQGQSVYLRVCYDASGLDLKMSFGACTNHCEKTISMP